MHVYCTSSKHAYTSKTSKCINYTVERSWNNHGLLYVVRKPYFM